MTDENVEGSGWVQGLVEFYLREGVREEVSHRNSPSYKNWPYLRGIPSSLVGLTRQLIMEPFFSTYNIYLGLHHFAEVILYLSTNCAQTEFAKNIIFVNKLMSVPLKKRLTKMKTCSTNSTIARPRRVTWKEEAKSSILPSRVIQVSRISSASYADKHQYYLYYLITK